MMDIYREKIKEDNRRCKEAEREREKERETLKGKRIN
jgi:hypothetical protein